MRNKKNHGRAKVHCQVLNNSSNKVYGCTCIHTLVLAKAKGIKIFKKTSLILHCFTFLSTLFRQTSNRFTFIPSFPGILMYTCVETCVCKMVLGALEPQELKLCNWLEQNVGRRQEPRGWNSLCTAIKQKLFQVLVPKWGIDRRRLACILSQPLPHIQRTLLYVAASHNWGVDALLPILNHGVCLHAGFVTHRQKQPQQHWTPLAAAAYAHIKYMVSMGVRDERAICVIKHSAIALYQPQHALLLLLSRGAKPWRLVTDVTHNKPVCAFFSNPTVHIALHQAIHPEFTREMIASDRIVAEGKWRWILAVTPQWFFSEK